MGRIFWASVIVLMVTANLYIPRGTEAVSISIHLVYEKKLPKSCCCLHCCVETRLVTLMDQAGLSFSLCFLCSTSEHHVASYNTCTTCTGKEMEGGGDSKIQYNVQGCHTAEIIVCSK